MGSPLEHHQLDVEGHVAARRMRRLSSIGFHLQTLFRKRKLDAQLSEEVRMHLEMATEANIAEGMTPEAARRAALREFGNVAGFQERTRDERGWGWLDQIGKDFALACRSLLRARAFSCTVVTTLFLGISAAATAFLLSYYVLFRPVPYPDAERLVAIGVQGNWPGWPVCWEIQLQAYLQQTQVFSQFAAARREECNVVVDGEPVASVVNRISTDFVATLGLSFTIGRGFLADEHGEGAEPVAMISDSFWRKHFDRSPAALGQHVMVDAQACTIVGVFHTFPELPQFLHGDVFRPFAFTTNPGAPVNYPLRVVGRLRPGITPEQATADIAGVRLDVQPTFAGFFAQQIPCLFTLRDGYRGEKFYLLCAAGAMLFVIAVLNATNLMLARVSGRSRELTVRLAIGASRWRVRRLLMAESMLLCILVAGATAAYAKWIFPRIYEMLVGITVEPENVVIGLPAWVLIMSLTLVAGATFTIIPSIRTLGDNLQRGLQSGGSRVGESRQVRRLGRIFVVTQAALAVILLSGTGLLLKSLHELRQVDLGFDPAQLAKVRFVFPPSMGYDQNERHELLRKMQQAFKTMPGVADAAYGSQILLRGTFEAFFQLKIPDGPSRSIQPVWSSPQFGEVTGLRLRSGRWMSGTNGHHEIVISSSLAQSGFGERDPIGETVEIALGHGLPEKWQIVGVAQDVREVIRAKAGDRVYFPDWFLPTTINTFVLRLQGPPDAEFAAAVRRTIYQFDPRVITAESSMFPEILDRYLFEERFAFFLLRAFAGVALVLAVLGLFSVLAYSVARRRHEFGLRSALGATSAVLSRMVVREGLTLSIIGISIGTAVALGLTQYIRSLLFETTPHDPSVFVGVAGLLLVVAIIASWLPARRAATVDPATALRAE